MKTNEIITVDISDITYGGEGVGKSAGMVVFVPGGVPGDELRIKIYEVKSSFARGEIVEIKKPSADRVEPKCPLYADCGGCQWQHINYPAQLRYKTKLVREALGRIGKLEGVRVNDMIGMEEPWGFRNRSSIP